MVIWYIFSVFECLDKEKSGNPVQITDRQNVDTQGPPQKNVEIVQTN
jgi:hypothetical protein